MTNELQPQNPRDPFSMEVVRTLPHLLISLWNFVGIGEIIEHLNFLP